MFNAVIIVFVKDYSLSIILCDLQFLGRFFKPLLRAIMPYESIDSANDLYLYYFYVVDI